MTDEVIRFRAQVSQVRTLADGGLRFVLDVAESEIDAAMKLMQVKQAGGVLEVAAVPLQSNKEQYAIRERSERKPKGQSTEG
jgi:hypothetical protein